MRNTLLEQPTEKVDINLTASTLATCGQRDE
jgi:hypothetical protein